MSTDPSLRRSTRLTRPARLRVEVGFAVADVAVLRGGYLVLLVAEVLGAVVGDGIADGAVGVSQDTRRRPRSLGTPKVRCNPPRS